MPVSEAEVIAARLARMKKLIDALQTECAASAEQRETFLKLKRELEITLQVVKPSGGH